MIVPASCWVCALNALQNSMMFTPCWPRAGPTGGAGLAAPAGTWSLISVRTLRAIWLDLLHLVEADFDRSLAAKDRHKHANLARVVHHLGDLTREVGERAGHDLDRFAGRELCPRARPLGGLALEQTVDLGLRERHRLVLRADESRHARRALDDGPRVLVQVHVDEYVARHRALLRLHALAVLHLGDLLGRNHDLAHVALRAHRLDAVLEIRLDLLLVTRIGVDRVPAEHCAASSLS